MTDKDKKTDSQDSQNNSAQQKAEQHNPTPKENDELFIELDDSHESQNAENKKTEPTDKTTQASSATEKTTNQQTKNTMTDSHKTESKKSSKSTGAKPGKPKIPQLKRINIGKNGKKIILIFSAVIVFLAIGGTIMFKKYPETLAVWMPFLEIEGYAESDVIDEAKSDFPVSEADETISRVDKETDEKARDKSTEDKNETTTANSAEEEDEKEVSEDEVVDKITENLQQSQTDTKPADAKIKTPAWLIGYASVSQKKNAVRNVKALREKGFSAGYYWIPDYKQAGPELYKVYIGPFESQSDAQNSLSNVKDLMPNAYVMILQ
ncbi:MAG: SPOR domain-containing protein [Bacteroidales bacterium]